jgi:hypothetical protein
LHFPVPLGGSSEASAETSVQLWPLPGDLLRDLRNAGVHLKAWHTLAGDQNLWNAITPQKMFSVAMLLAAGGASGYAWLDLELLDQDTELSLPTPSSYASVLLGFSSISTQSTPSATKSSGLGL